MSAVVLGPQPKDLLSGEEGTIVVSCGSRFAAEGPLSGRKEPFWSAVFFWVHSRRPLEGEEGTIVSGFLGPLQKAP